LDNDIEVTLKVKNKEDKDVLAKTLLVRRDLTFSPKVLPRKMCLAAHARNKRALQIHHYLYVLIERKNLLAVGLLDLLMIVCVTLPATIVVRLFIGSFVKGAKKGSEPAAKGKFE
jgi:hypothetical protein